MKDMSRSYIALIGLLSLGCGGGTKSSGDNLVKKSVILYGDIIPMADGTAYRRSSEGDLDINAPCKLWYISGTKVSEVLPDSAKQTFHGDIEPMADGTAILVNGESMWRLDHGVIARISSDGTTKVAVIKGQNPSYFVSWFKEKQLRIQTEEERDARPDPDADDSSDEDPY